MTSTAAPNPPTPADAPLQDALAPGTRFFELEILRVLGVGGFGIVYLARDHSLERDVALKEYMPAALASRTGGSQVTVRSGSFADTYAVGLRSFVNEAKLLARFDHPSLVKVYRFWEANGTAYMVMPYLQGRTLREARRAMTVPPDERWIRSVFDPVLDALERLHREEVYHRDIAPDNILLPDEGPPVLLDFGAARQVISGRTQSLTAILKPSYAPIEQYAELAHLRQGPWTDIYALGAVMHYLLYGAPPSPATARAVQDDLGDLGARPVAGVSPRLLAVVAWALAVRPQERPQDVATMRAALDGRHPVPEPGHLDIPVPSPAAPAPDAPFEPTIRVDAVPVTAPVPAPMPAVADALTRVNVPATVPAPPPRHDTPPLAPAVQPAARSRGFGLALGVVGVVLAVVVAGWAWRRPARAPAAPPPIAAAAPAPTPAPVPAPAPVVAPEPTAAAPVAGVVAAPPTVDTAPSAAAAPPARSASRPARARPAVRPTEAPAATATPRAATPEPAPAPAVAAPVPAAPPAVAAPAPAATVAAGPASAREACGKRVFLALARCMEEQCENPRFAGQRDCLRVIEMRNRRDGR